MPVYLYQGQHYTIATDDPAEAKRKIQASLDQSTYTPPQTPVSAMPAPVEGSGGAAFGVYRPAGRRPESQQDREASKDMPLQTARGLVTGTLGAIPDLINLPGAVYGAVTGEEPGYRVPGGSEDLNRALPGQSNTPQARLARFGGEMLAPIPTLKGAQAIGQGARMAATGVQNTVGAVGDVARGAFNAATGGETALAPLGKTYVTPEGADLFRQGRIDIATLESPQYTRPISELATGAVDRAALKVAGNQIPLAGQGAQAFGERVMSDYIANPYKAAVDIGLPFLTGGAVPPIYALGRGLQAGADMRLAGKGFDPGLQQQVAQAKTQQAFQPAPAPRLTYNPTPPGPVDPTTMYATPGGQMGANLSQMDQVAMAEKYPSAPAPVSPAEVSQQAAAARIQQTLAPEQQAIVDQVRARAQAQEEASRAARVAALQQRAQAAGGYTPPVAEAPVVPVAPTAVPETPPATTNTLTSLRDRLTPQTPEELAAVEAYNAKTPADKAAQTRAEKIAKTPTPTKTSDVLKATEGRAAVESALASGEPATIKYKTSAGITTEDINQSINFKPDPDLALTRRINRPDNSNTLFGTEKSSGRPVKVEIADMAASDSSEFIKVFDNSNPKSPVLIKTYDANGTMTSSPKNVPPGVSNMMTDDQAAMMNALRLPADASAMERKIATGTQATRDKLEAELGKNLMDPSIDRFTKEIISNVMNLFDKYRNKP